MRAKNLVSGDETMSSVDKHSTASLTERLNGKALVGRVKQRGVKHLTLYWQGLGLLFTGSYCPACPPHEDM